MLTLQENMVKVTTNVVSIKSMHLKQLHTENSSKKEEEATYRKCCRFKLLSRTDKFERKEHALC